MTTLIRNRNRFHTSVQGRTDSAEPQWALELDNVLDAITTHGAPPPSNNARVVATSNPEHPVSRRRRGRGPAAYRVPPRVVDVTSDVQSDWVERVHYVYQTLMTSAMKAQGR